MMKKVYLITFVATALLLSCGGGNSGKGNAETKDSVGNVAAESLVADTVSLMTDEEEAAEEEGNQEDADSDGGRAILETIITSIAKGDAKSFAKVVEYPLQRKYPLKWIENEKQMIRYFDTMIDDKLRKGFKRLTVDDWAGPDFWGYYLRVPVDDGIYIHAEYKLMIFPYYSKKETALFNRLVSKELASMHKSLSSGKVRPFLCLEDQDNKAIYRLDYIGDDNEKLRLAVFKNKSRLSAKPDYVMDVQHQDVGAAHGLDCNCVDKDSGFSLYFLYGGVNDEKEFKIEYKASHSDKEEKHTVHRVYWLDYIV